MRSSASMRVDPEEQRAVQPLERRGVVDGPHGLDQHPDLSEHERNDENPVRQPEQRRPPRRHAGRRELDQEQEADRGEVEGHPPCRVREPSEARGR